MATLNQQWSAQQFAAAQSGNGATAADASQYAQGYYDAAGNYHYYDYSQYYAQTTATTTTATFTTDSDSTQSKLLGKESGNFEPYLFFLKGQQIHVHIEKEEDQNQNRSDIGYDGILLFRSVSCQKVKSNRRFMYRANYYIKLFNKYT